MIGFLIFAFDTRVSVLSALQSRCCRFRYYGLDILGFGLFLLFIFIPFFLLHVDCGMVHKFAFFILGLDTSMVNRIV